VVIAIGQQARDDAELAELNRTMRAEGSQVLDAIIRDAADRGELPVSIRADVAVAQLVGALLFRYLFEDTEALNPAFVEAVVEQFLARDASQVERPPASLTAGAGR
jgi:hypothetical protein